MKILIVRFTDQPAVNIVENISRHSKHDCSIITRDNLNIQNKSDIVFYYNVNDIFQPAVYKMLHSTQQQVAVGAQSWRLLLEKDWIDKLKLLNIVGVCSPSEEILSEVLKRLPAKVSAHTPFSADDRKFRETRTIDVNGRLRVGYVGTFREDKQYNVIVKPAFDALKGKIDLVIYGRASGKRLAHHQMIQAYNEMDCIVVGSKYESGPMPPIEAALCGRPTITTRCGMMEYTFKDGGAIFIDNNYESLVGAVNKFISNKQLCIDIGKEAKNILINDRSWSNSIEPQDKFFDEILNVSQEK